EFKRGTFRVTGDTIDIYPAYADYAYRVYMWGDDVENIFQIDPGTGKQIHQEKAITIYPANLFITGKDSMNNAIKDIQDDLVAQMNYFESEGRFLEAKRIKE